MFIKIDSNLIKESVFGLEGYCRVNNFEYFSLKLDQRVFETPELTNSVLSIPPPQIACFPSFFGSEIVQYAKAFN